MVIAPGTYNMTIQRRSDHSVDVTLKDSGGSAVNLTGYTLASQVWNPDRTTKAADATGISLKVSAIDLNLDLEKTGSPP